MNVKISLLLAVLGRAYLVGAASALPVANMPSNPAEQTQIRNDEDGDMARQTVRGATGHDSHRNRDHHRRRGWGHGDHREHRDEERGPRSHRHDD